MRGAVAYLAALALASLAGAGLAKLRQAEPPRLVGYGCTGAAGPLFADEESSFPPCLIIERNIQNG